MAKKPRKTKNVSLMIKNSLIQEFKLEKLTTTDKNCLKHCSELFQKNSDVERVEEMVDLYNIRNTKSGTTFADFYFWYKDHRLSVEDSIVYQAFDLTLENLNYPPCDPSPFSGLGDYLLEKLKNYISGSGNLLADTLLDYFNLVLPAALSFNTIFASSPKSILGSYGWNLFQESIDKKYNGKIHYLVATTEQLQIAKQEKDKLLAIDKIKRDFLGAGDLKTFDTIGKALSTKPIGLVYEEIQNGYYGIPEALQETCSYPARQL